MKKRLLPMLLSASMIATLLPVPAAAASVFEDVQGHWGERAVERWVSYGIVNGDNGLFRPNDSLTRGEMAVIIANLLQLEPTAGNNPFADLDENWYTDALLACYEAGIFSGDAAGTIRPQDTITRQEAMVVLGNALRIAPKDGELSGFADSADVAGWASGFVKALTDAGIVSGVGDGLLQPTAEISRASVVTILNNAVAGYAAAEGDSVTVNGGLVIVASKDVTISGTADAVLVLHSAAAGEVTLDNLSVSGTLTVEGQDAAIVLTGETAVDSVVFSDAAEGAALTVGADANAGAVTVSAARARITVDGSVERISLAESAGESSVTVRQDASVETLTTEAPKTEIVVAGQVADVTVRETAAESTMDVASTGAVTDLRSDAEKVAVSGNGTVENATVSGDDTTINTDGTKLEVENGTDGVTENGSNVNDGNQVITGTTNNSGSGSTGTSSGGSSSSSTKKYTVTFNLTADGTVYSFSESVRRGNTTDEATETELGYALPEGSQITWYDANGNVFDFTQSITAATTITGVVGSNAFAGGNGSEEYPYLIGNAEEFKNIGTLSNAMIQTPYHFALTADIDLSQENISVVTTYFQGVLEGNDHKIIGSAIPEAGSCIVYDTMDDVEFRNLTLVQNGTKYTTLAALINRRSGHNKGNVKFVRVNIEQSQEGAVVACGNNDGPYCNHVYDGTLTFENCNNYADFNYATYGGLYVGGFALQAAKVIFQDCTNYGDLTGANVALFIGNPSNGPAQVAVQNCTNAGMVWGVTTQGWFSRYGNSSIYQALNGLVSVAGNPLGNTSAIKVEITGVSKNENGTLSFKVAADNATAVSYYVVKARHSSTFKRPDNSSGGSSYVVIQERINGGAAETNTTIPFGNYSWFIDSTTYGKEVSYTGTEAYVGARYAVMDDGVVVFDASDMINKQDTNIASVSMSGAPTYIIEAYNAIGVMIGETTLQWKAVNPDNNFEYKPPVTTDEEDQDVVETPDVDTPETEENATPDSDNSDNAGENNTNTDESDTEGESTPPETDNTDANNTDTSAQDETDVNASEGTEEESNSGESNEPEDTSAEDASTAGDTVKEDLTEA